MNGDQPRAPNGTLADEAARTAQFARIQALCDAGELVAAERLCRQILKAAPGHPRAIRTLGEIFLLQGRHEEAIASLAPLVALYPDAGSARFRLGAALNAAGRHEEAARHLRRALELQPRFAGGHCDLGLALEKLGDGAGAIEAYERAVALAPDFPAARGNLGAALAKAGKFRDAVPHLRRACEAYPDAAKIHLLLGQALSQLAEEAQALRCYEKAVAVDARLVDGWAGLGASLRALGRFPEAAKAYERALAIDPQARAAVYGLSTIQHGITDAAELDRLRRTSANPDIITENRQAAAMALVKKLDESGRYDEAFAAAVEGNRLARAAQEAADIRHDHDGTRAGVDAVMRAITPEFLAGARDWGNPTELPVFIVGFFRTGSTLTEQICASHSRVHGIGESDQIPELVAEIHRTEPRPSHWTARMFKDLADRHLERLTALAPGKLRVVDKMLDNVYHLGLIATLFPRARVIFTHRDGRDAALSVFLRQFGERVAFATDLIDIGRRWRETERMASYWARCLPLPMRHVQYETLIGDFEAEARKLIEFLGLAWEPACLEFFKTERAVQTLSAWQVRQPLYSSSVGGWRHYAKHLGPLCEALGIDPDATTGARPADISSCRRHAPRRGSVGQ